MVQDLQSRRIIERFTLGAPPQQRREILKSITALVEDSEDREDSIQAACRQYNLRNYAPICISLADLVERDALPTKHVMLVTPHNEIQVNSERSSCSIFYYYDAILQSFVVVDHVQNTGEVLHHLDAGLTSLLEQWNTTHQHHAALRRLLSRKLKKYLTSQFHVEEPTFSVICETPTPDGMASVQHMYFHKEIMDLVNHWSAQWISQFTLVVPITDGLNDSGAEQIQEDVVLARLSGGQCKVKVHYYEQGNIQLEVVKEIIPTSQVSTHCTPTTLGIDPASTADLDSKEIERKICDWVISTLSEFDSVLQQQITQFTRTMSNNSLKTLRRPLPITKQLYDFQRAVAQTLAANNL